MELVFATNNTHKVREVMLLLSKNIHLKNLRDIGCQEDLPETGNTLDGNASQKARYVFDKYGSNCFADDTGLEIEALNGQPGVLSARYAGAEKDPAKNIEKVLGEMKNMNNRNAIFRTVISLIFNSKEYQFEGIIKGSISTEKKGEMGFGYDPVFVPLGYSKSFAEMPLEGKNKISHRAIAVRKLADFLNGLKG